MKRYKVSFRKYGINLEGETREELIQNFVGSFGNPQNFFNYIINNLRFSELLIEEATISDNNDTGKSVQETPND